MAKVNKSSRKQKSQRKKGKWAPLAFLLAILALPILDMTMLAGDTLVQRHGLPFSNSADAHVTRFTVEEKNTNHTIKIDSGQNDVVLAWSVKRDGLVIKSYEERYPAQGVRRVDFKPTKKGLYTVSVRRISKKGTGPATLGVTVIANDRQLLMPIFDALGL